MGIHVISLRNTLLISIHMSTTPYSKNINTTWSKIICSPAC